MHPEDLQMLWICRECNARFAFHSDADDHKLKSGHLLIVKHDILSGKVLA
jgi:hypothetical protein